MHRRALLVTAAALAVAGWGPTAFGQTAADPVVVELFTSQGCNSCPPADALLAELSQREDIVALSLHVDYWDYLGWHDTFASRATSDRQHAYARSLGERRVYTPQAVVGGRFHAVGSDRAAVEALIAEARATPAMPLDITPGPALRLPERRGIEPATVWIVGLDALREVPVARGENAGRTLVYRNVVREIRKLGEWRGQPMTLPLPDDLAGRDGRIVLVQSGVAGPILGCRRLGRAGAR
jgi:hypothetical protein